MTTPLPRVHAHRFSALSRLTVTGTAIAALLLVGCGGEDGDATPIIEFDHDVARVQIRGVTIRSPRVNWGADEDRIRATMLTGAPG